MRAVRQHGPALEVRAAPLHQLGERYRRYRLVPPQGQNLGLRIF
jgi:hypothetical protein